MIQRLLITALLVALIGCDRSSTDNGVPASASGGRGSSAAGPPPAIMQPFQGKWRFSLAKTLAQWQTDGVPAAEIAQAKMLAASFPLHPDMAITGTTAILSRAPLEGSYDFFALHAHGPWVCGKAWRHEDRHDPGDMDKWMARLQIKNGDLHLPLRGDENPPAMNDPDIVTMPPLAGTAATCTADGLPEPPWSAWRTYVFERAPAE